MLKHLKYTNFRTLESGHVFHANLNRKHLIHFQKGMKGNKCNERLQSPPGSHGSIAGSRAIRQWEKRGPEWEVLDLLHGITSERKPELRQCDAWELKPRHRSGECWADFSSVFQSPYFSSPQPKFDDLGTNLPLSISLYSFSLIYFIHYLFLFVSFPTYFIHRETLLKKPMFTHAHIFLF